MSNALTGDRRRIVGVDAGATLCKMVRGPAAEETQLIPSVALDEIRAALEAWGPTHIIATGGGVDKLGPQLGGTSLRRVPEFDAWASGAPILARLEGIDLPPSYLLVSLGTGTSILLVGPDGAGRVGGSALGGGTLLGLGRLLLRASSFDEIAELAERGDRRRVDLLVGDIYENEELPLPRELNASSFAKHGIRGASASSDPADLAHALIGLVGENVALICGELARSRGAQAVLYCGTTLAHNPALADVLAGVTSGFGARPFFLARGAFCGAVGAASLATD